MRPDEKAKDLKDKFQDKALLVIDEILNCVYDFAYVGTTWDKQYDDGGGRIGEYDDASKYWTEVKEELEKP